MQELLRAEEPIHGVIGPGCSSACEATAFLTAERGLTQVFLAVFDTHFMLCLGHVPVWQVSYGCTADVLSSGKKYPTFARSKSKKSALAPALVGLLKWAQWTEVIVLYEDAVSFVGEYAT